MNEVELTEDGTHAILGVGDEHSPTFYLDDQLMDQADQFVEAMKQADISDEMRFRDEAKKLSHRRLHRRPAPNASEAEIDAIEAKILAAKSEDEMKQIPNEERLKFILASRFGLFSQDDLTNLRVAEWRREERQAKTSEKLTRGDYPPAIQIQPTEKTLAHWARQDEAKRVKLEKKTAEAAEAEKAKRVKEHGYE